MHHSEQIGELAKALASARRKFKVIKKDQSNPFYKSKYADLSAIIEATETALSENGIAVVQSPRFDGDKQTVTVNTMLIHESGQWMSDDLALPVTKPDPQGAGSAITYARRYAYGSFLNVAAEVDDDANAASGKDLKQAMPKPPKVVTKTNGEGNQAPFAQAFWAKCRVSGRSTEQVREYLGSLGYEHTDEVPPARQNEALAWAAGTQ
jgi:hypothetical protein